MDIIQFDSQYASFMISTPCLHQLYSCANIMNIICPIRIIDGLFLGDQTASYDLEFLVANKISRIVNCAAKQLPNHWESIGILYLPYPWLESELQFQFDLARCFFFINEAILSGEAVLVHSIKASNRSVFVISAFLMKKFRWSLMKTLQYIYHLKKDLEVRQNVFTQLMQLEEWLSMHKQGPKTTTWEQVVNEEDLLVRNSYINSQPAQNYPETARRKQHKRVRWAPQLVTLQIPPYMQMYHGPLPSKFKEVKSRSTHTTNTPPIKLEAKLNYPSPKKMTLDQIANQQLQKKMELGSFRVKLNNFVENPASRALSARPSTAPPRKVFAHRLLKSNSQRSPLTRRIK